MFGLRDIGWEEILLILVILLLVFGAAKLPQIGSSLGKSIREFRKAANGELDDKKEANPKTPEENTENKTK